MTGTFVVGDGSCCAGVCSFIRTGKASHAMMVSLFKVIFIWMRLIDSLRIKYKRKPESV